MRLTFPLMLCVALALGVSSPVLAEPRDVSSMIEKKIAEAGTPGVVYQEYQGGQLVAHGRAGMRMRGQDSPIDYGDVMHWGSMGKAQTALLFANLIQAGVVESFDAKLVDFLPQDQQRDLIGNDPRYSEITIRQLLGMSSGINDDHVAAGEDTNDDDMLFKLYRFNTDPQAGRRWLVRYMAEHYQLDAKPGTTYSYSNIGYTLAGHAAENAWNAKHPHDPKTYEQLMQERIFEPLGIKTARPGAPGLSINYRDKLFPASPTPVVIGHNMTDGQPAPDIDANQPVGLGWRYADLPLTITPAGLWTMTIDDMARLEHVHMQQEQTRLLDRVGVSLAQIEDIRAPVIKVNGELMFTMGWLRDMSKRDTTYLMYQGSNQRWISTISIDVAKQHMRIAGSNSGTDENGKMMRALVAQDQPISSPTD